MFSGGVVEGNQPIFMADDEDNDGVCNPSDCMPNESGSWGIPGEGTNLRLMQVGAQTIFTWNPPANTGGNSVVYDVFVAPRAEDFDPDCAREGRGSECTPSCILSGGSDPKVVSDAAPPVAGELFLYVFRAGTACGNGSCGPVRACPEECIPL